MSEGQCALEKNNNVNNYTYWKKKWKKKATANQIKKIQK